jgi:hypothetical protein
VKVKCPAVKRTNAARPANHLQVMPARAGKAFSQTGNIYIWRTLPHNSPVKFNKKSMAGVITVHQENPAEETMRKYSFILLALFVVGLYVFQNKAVLPFIMNVVESDLFVEKEKGDEQLGKISNERTALALSHCQVFMKDRGQAPQDAVFNSDDYEAWALGNQTYLIKSYVDINRAEKGVARKAFACKIRYTGGDDADSNSWSVQGLDFHPSADEG